MLLIFSKVLMIQVANVAFLLTKPRLQPIQQQFHRKPLEILKVL